MKPLIHFAHANGVPSKVYQKLFDLLSDQYDVIYVPLLGPYKNYPIDNHWKSLTQQVIDSIVRQAQGRKVIGDGPAFDHGQSLVCITLCEDVEVKNG